MVVADIWPFLPTMSDKSTDSAWPHKKPNGFLIIYFMWDGAENDSVWIKQMTTALGHIREIALQENCTTPDAPVYCNTALDVTTTPQQIYRDHLVKLSQLRRKFDPHQVMDRTGGFRIPFMLEGNIINASISNAIGSKAHSGPPIHSGPIEVIDEVGENIVRDPALSPPTAQPRTDVSSRSLHQVTSLRSTLFPLSVTPSFTSPWRLRMKFGMSSGRKVRVGKFFLNLDRTIVLRTRKASVLLHNQRALYL